VLLRRIWWAGQGTMKRWWMLLCLNGDGNFVVGGGSQRLPWQQQRRRDGKRRKRGRDKEGSLWAGWGEWVFRGPVCDVSSPMDVWFVVVVESRGGCAVDREKAKCKQIILVTGQSVRPTQFNHVSMRPKPSAWQPPKFSYLKCWRVTTLRHIVMADAGVPIDFRLPLCGYARGLGIVVDLFCTFDWRCALRCAAPQEYFA